MKPSKSDETKRAIANARHRAYYQKNAAKERQRVKDYYKRHPEKLKARQERWRAANPDKVKRYQKTWRERVAGVPLSPEKMVKAFEKLGCEIFIDSATVALFFDNNLDRFRANALKLAIKKYQLAKAT